MRQQKELPVTRLYYYLDRLTVVQDNYGQGIVIADGDNVVDMRRAAQASDIEPAASVVGDKSTIGSAI